MSVFKVADLWPKLMTQGLGYQRFGAQGGDWGAAATSHLGFTYPDQVIGIHLTSVNRPLPYLGPGSRPLSKMRKNILTNGSAGNRLRVATPTSRGPSRRPCPTG